MNKIHLLLLILTLNIMSVEFCIAQSYTTTSKNCGKCGKNVSTNSTVGQTCPYCGARWGSENTNTTSSYRTNQIYRQKTKINKSKKQSKTYTSNKANQPNITPNISYSDSNTTTKTETENWILEKLNAYTPKKYYDNVDMDDRLFSDLPSPGWYYMNYKYSFDNHYLNVEYEKEYSGKITKYLEKIPIYDIDRVYNYNGNLWITTKRNTLIEYISTNNLPRVEHAFTTEFSSYAETDICARLHTAFIHLKKFYTKPLSTEPF